MLKWRPIILLIFFVTIFTAPARAAAVNLYFVQPDGEGDTASAKPYLQSFFDHVAEISGVTVDGLYLNDEEEAVSALQNKKVQLAVVSPAFYQKYKDKFAFKKILDTIPIYSNGPYEKYYIMAHADTDVLALMDQQIRVNLFTGKTYTDDFLNEKIFFGNDEIKKIPWHLRQTDDLFGAIKKIADSGQNTFVLLTGHEFSVINKMRRGSEELSSLKLVYTSKELPSHALVSVNGFDGQDLKKLTNTLVGLSKTLKGNLVLKKLRLKGFATLK